MDLIFTEAVLSDLDGIVAMLADDKLGATRENYQQPLPDSYLKAFAAIDQDPNAQLIVVKVGEKIIAVAQINFIANITYQGSTRALIEGVRVHKDYRSHGVGQQLFEYLIQCAKQRQCHMVQLTTNKSRPDAYRFYENLGFVNSHEGFKLLLDLSI